MIDPDPLAIIEGAESFDRCHSAVTLISIDERKRSMVSSSTATDPPTPALLTSTSTRPCRSTTSATSRSRALSSAMSATMTSAPGNCAASDSRRSARRAVSTTYAPTPWSTLAKCAPRPDDAPVTSTTWPSSRNRSSGDDGDGDADADAALVDMAGDHTGPHATGRSRLNTDLSSTRHLPVISERAIRCRRRQSRDTSASRVWTHETREIDGCMKRDVELSTWNAVIKLAAVVSVIAALAAVAASAAGDIPQVAIVLPVIVVAFSASWIQTNRVRREHVSVRHS